MSLGLTLTNTVSQTMHAMLLWPIWWYTKGLVWMLEVAKRMTVHTSRQLAVGVWVKNLFVPMFGLHDWQSRIISVFMRSLQIVGRSLGILAWLGLVISLTILYLVAPLMAIGLTIFHISAFF